MDKLPEIFWRGPGLVGKVNGDGPLKTASNLPPPVARNEMSIAGINELRRFAFALILRIFASRRESTGLRRVNRVRHVSGQDYPLFPAFRIRNGNC